MKSSKKSPLIDKTIFKVPYYEEYIINVKWMHVWVITFLCVSHSV